VGCNEVTVGMGGMVGMFLTLTRELSETSVTVCRDMFGTSHPHQPYPPDEEV
jgi:hypothetical protein